VWRRAGLSPRYFYESFHDLDALVIAVFDGIVADAGARVLAAVDDAPGEAFAKARAAIGAFVTHLTDDPRRARVAFVEAMGVEALVRRRFEAMRGFADLVAAQGGAFYGVDPAGEPLVDVTASLLVGGMAELLMRWLDGDVPLAREQLIDDMTELFVATGESAVAIARRRARATTTAEERR
jgi:AcrR family transcriptional regulator